MKKIFFVTLLLLLFAGVGCSQRDNTPLPSPETLPNINGGATDVSDNEISGNNTVPAARTTDNAPSVPDDVTRAAVPKERGNSSGEVPYAPVDKTHVVSRLFGKEGGVLSTTLSGGVKMFVVVPRDSVIEDARVSILPYTAMPSGPQHPALNNSYGYGAEVLVESIQIGVDMYVVFDTTGGVASAAYSDTSRLYLRCDPSSVRFNPYVCAHRLGTSHTNVAELSQGIVSPIHNEEFNTLVFPRSTIPTYPGLLVTRLGRSDVFIPQKYDKELVTVLVNSVLGRFSNDLEQLEAAALAVAWNIPLNDEQTEQAVDAIGAGEYYDEFYKGIAVGSRLASRVTAWRDATEDEDERETWEYLADDIDDNVRRLTDNIYELAGFDSGRHSVSDDTYVAAATVVDMAKTSFVRAADSARAMYIALTDVYENPPRQYDTIIDAGEAGTVLLDMPSTSGEEPLWGGGSGASDASAGTPPGGAGAPPSGGDGGSGEGSSGSPGSSNGGGDSGTAPGGDVGGESGGRQGGGPKILDLTDILNDILNDPQSSATDLLDAAALAQAMGLDNADDYTKKALDRIAKKIENSIKNGKANLNTAALAQSIGRDDLADQILAMKKDDCDLVHKTLANYGINACD